MKRFLLLAGMLLLGQLAFAQNNGTYISVLKIPALDNAPGYIYINTKIPATDIPAPQIQITGYMYGNGNRAMKLTLGWYWYNGSFYWKQFHSDLGYVKPSRVRLGTYTDGGTSYIRIELSNDGGYWANYTVSATDRYYCSTCYTDWSYGEGEMPSGTTSNITTVPHQADVTVYGNLLVGKTSQSNTNYRIDVDGKLRANEVVVNTTGADFVFQDGYKVRTLEELERFILANKHLPDIPPAKTMQEEGVGVSELQTRLLQKIEELTLYLIEKDKQLKQANERIDALAQKVNQLTAKP